MGPDLVEFFGQVFGALVQRDFFFVDVVDRFRPTELDEELPRERNHHFLVLDVLLSFRLNKDVATNVDARLVLFQLLLLQHLESVAELEILGKFFIDLVTFLSNKGHLRPHLKSDLVLVADDL